MITHKEFSMKVLAPDTPEGTRCCYYGCKIEGQWALHVAYDRGDCMAHYDPLCEKHLLFAILDSLEESDYGRPNQTTEPHWG